MASHKEADFMVSEAGFPFPGGEVTAVVKKLLGGKARMFWGCLG